MKLHLMSDTHSDNGDIFIPKLNADVCILAGDICIIKHTKLFHSILTKCKKQFEHVILVLGNHEFYYSNYKTALDTIKRLADETHVHLLDIQFGTENLTLDGITFWGSTLWTDFNKDNFFIKMKVKKGLNDSLLINGLNINKMYDIHVETVKRINWDADVVITHHKPILRPHTLYNITDITYGFCCTDLEKQIEDSNIKYWLYGHTHDNQIDIIGNTTVVSNQSGYNATELPNFYNPSFVIDISI